MTYLYLNPPVPEWPVFSDYTDNDKPMWENVSPAYKGSSSKGGRSDKQIKQDRKKKKMNRRKHKKI